MSKQRRYRWDPRLAELLHRRPELYGIGITSLAREFVA